MLKERVNMPNWLLNSQVENEQTIIPNFLFYVDIAMTNTKKQPKRTTARVHKPEAAINNSYTNGEIIPLYTQLIKCEGSQIHMFQMHLINIPQRTTIHWNWWCCSSYLCINYNFKKIDAKLQMSILFQVSCFTLINRSYG